MVRENDNRVRETEELRMAMELGTQQLVEAIEKETSDRKKQVKNVENEFSDAMKKDKSDLVGKIETANDEMKKKMEMETNEIRYYFFLDSLLNNAPLIRCTRLFFPNRQFDNINTFTITFKKVLKKKVPISRFVVHIFWHFYGKLSLSSN